MARLLVFWTRPRHLSADEAESWVRTEVERLLALESIDHAELTRLESASLRYPRAWDWLLEVHLAEGADPATCIQADPWVEWLADLRLLGMHPTTMLAANGRLLGSEDR